MSLLIHATITVSGDKSLLEACDVRINELLAEQLIDGEIAEHHGNEALCYDFKVKGGLPFPAFVMASQEFPALRIDIEWVNVGAGARGMATIVNGKLAEHTVDKLETAVPDTRPVYVLVAENGRLELALTFFRSNRDVWVGYALTAERDALLHLMRVPDSDEVEVLATEGSAEWSLRWRGSLARGAFEFETVPVPQAIDAQTYRELEQLAQGFVAEWIWFASGPREEIAIEKERYARAGFAVSEANVRSARLHRMKAEATDPEGPLEFSTLDADDAWVKDLVVRCWLGEKSP